MEGKMSELDPRPRTQMQGKSVWLNALDCNRGKCLVQQPRVRMELVRDPICAPICMYEDHLTRMRCVGLHGQKRLEHHMNLCPEKCREINSEIPTDLQPKTIWCMKKLAKITHVVMLDPDTD